MLKAGGGAGLANETLGAMIRPAVAMLGREQFQRDVALENGVLGDIDTSHRAFAELIHKFEALDAATLPRRRICRRRRRRSSGRPRMRRRSQDQLGIL